MLGKIAKHHDLPNPNESLMPRKELLRKKQQALLKKTDVAFYRQHMRRHFDKILEAVELTFDSSTRQRQRVMVNLAKPVTDTEPCAGLKL